jgi:hypothetical protein
MKRKAVRGSIEGRMRVIWRRLEVALEEVSRAEGGMKTPSSRKDFTFDMRRREEADGESRMMGCSMRRAGFFMLVGRDCGMDSFFWVAEGCFRKVLASLR